MYTNAYYNSTLLFIKTSQIGLDRKKQIREFLNLPSTKTALHCPLQAQLSDARKEMQELKASLRVAQKEVEQLQLEKQVQQPCSLPHTGGCYPDCAKTTGEESVFIITERQSFLNGSYTTRLEKNIPDLLRGP